MSTFPGLDDLARALRGASRVVAMTGAGTSAESGISTFRDAQTGLWARFRPEDLATPEAFERDPELVWRWYEWRREQIAAAAPNPGHHALARLEALLPDFLLVTQNVDGLHQQAGSEAIVELHGNIVRTICSATRRPIDEAWVEESTDEPPKSPHAPHGLARPDVVWFGETLPSDAIERAVAASVDCDVFLSIGTSAVVEPAASLGRMAAQQGSVVVEINPEATPLTPLARHVFQAPSGEVLPALLAAALAAAEG